MSYSPINTITTVAGREVAVATRNKGIIISLALTLVIIFAGVILATWLSGRESSDPELVVHGVSEAVFDMPEEIVGEELAPGPGPGMNAGLATLEVSTADSPEQAREMVLAEANAALINTGAGFDLISEGDPNPAVVATINLALSQYAQNEALATVGVAPEEYYDAMPPISLNIVNIGQETDFPAVLTVLSGVAILVYFIILFAGNIGSRVTEEKSSRVVEIILSSTRPLDFLAGKLLGNLVVGLVGTVTVLGSAIIALWASGLLNDFDLDLTVLPILTLSFALGLLFFGSLWAAAGAMVSRTEDLASTQTPIMILIFGVIYAPAFGWSMLDSTLMQVLTWVPPFSLSVAPLQAAAGNLSWPMVLLSYAIMAALTVVVLAVVARIYRNAILHNGRKMKWAQAMKTRS